VCADVGRAGVGRAARGFTDGLNITDLRNGVGSVFHSIEVPVLKSVEEMKQELEQVEEGLVENSVRVEPLGTDRHHNCYWALSVRDQNDDENIFAVHVERSTWPKLSGK